MRNGSTTYANVVATLALFLALTGGVAFAATQLGKNSVKSSNIAKGAVKSQDIAKKAVKSKHLAPKAVKGAALAPGAVTGAKVKAGSLGRSSLNPAALSGLQVMDVSSSTVPGLTSNPSGVQGTPVSLTGTPSFIPAAGKSYLLLSSIEGDPVDADGTGGDGNWCEPRVSVFANGNPMGSVGIEADAELPAPYNLITADGTSTAIALSEPGVAQNITAEVFGDPGCGAATRASLRITVVEFG